MIGYLKYNNLRYAIFVNAKFGSCQFLIKPESLEAALTAEDIDIDKAQDFASAFEEDWHLCKYRADIAPGKISTTINNKNLAVALAVAFNAAKKAVQKKHSLQNDGSYHSIWFENISTEDNLQATMYFSLGLVSSTSIKAGTLELCFKDESLDIKISDEPDFYSPAMHELRELCNKAPMFNPLSSEALKLYTLAQHYAGSSEYLAGLVPKRNGYRAIKLSGITAFPGASELTSDIVTEESVSDVYSTIRQVREAHSDKNTAWIEDCNYIMVTDENLPEIMKELWSAPIISFDTETTGLKINFMSREGLADELVGVCLSDKMGTGYYFPLQHKLFKNLCNGDHRFFMLQYMKELLEKKPIVCHNLSYDWKVAYIYDINVNCVFDTMLAFGVTKRYEYLDFSIGLKQLCSQLFHIDMFEIEDFVIGKWDSSAVTFADLPYELVAHYGPADADITLRLYYWCIQNRLLEKYNAQRVFDLEVNFAKVVAYSEFWGYHIDVAQLPALEKDVLDGMNKEKSELFAIAGHEFNPNSSVQLKKIIYDELKIPPIDEKKSTAKDILKSLASQKTPDGELLYPFASHLLEYRKYESTYKNFLKKKDIYISPDGYVFPGVQQLGTDTGRVSIKDPNYQSYNDVVKKRVTGRPGFYIFDCDFAQIEYRVLASMAGQEALIKAFDDPDLDYHTHQAARMFSVPYAAVSKQLRQQSKGINFGLPYGMGDKSLGKRVFGEASPENTAKAAELRKRFFQGQEKIQEFFKRVRDNGVRNGYTETWLGRRRYYHKTVFSEASIRRQAGNAVIQGTAADIWKTAVVRFFNRVVKNGWLGKVLFDGFIHDELMGECSVEIDPYEFLKAWREEYELSIDNFCKLYAGFGWGNSWYEAKKADYPPYFISQVIAKGEQPHTWDGDYKKLISDTKKELYAYETKRVVDWVTSQPSGTIIAPHINAYLYDKMTDFWSDIVIKHPELENIKMKNLSLDDLLSLFAEHENFSYQKGTILAPDTEVSAPQEVAPQEEAPELTEEQLKRLQMNKQQQICQNVFAFGFMLDSADMVLYLRYINEQMKVFFENTYCSAGANPDIRVAFLRAESNGSVSAIPCARGIMLSDFPAVNNFVREVYTHG